MAITRIVTSSSLSLSLIVKMDILTQVKGTKKSKSLMPLAHYYDVDRELHELQHRGELVPTRNEIMGKIGASMLLSYSGLVVSYVTREGLGFVHVLHSRS